MDSVHKVSPSIQKVKIPKPRSNYSSKKSSRVNSRRSSRSSKRLSRRSSEIVTVPKVVSSSNSSETAVSKSRCNKTKIILLILLILISLGIIAVVATFKLNSNTDYDYLEDKIRQRQLNEQRKRNKEKSDPTSLSRFFLKTGSRFIDTLNKGSKECLYDSLNYYCKFGIAAERNGECLTLKVHNCTECNAGYHLISIYDDDSQEMSIFDEPDEDFYIQTTKPVKSVCLKDDHDGHESNETNIEMTRIRFQNHKMMKKLKKSKQNRKKQKLVGKINEY